MQHRFLHSSPLLYIYDSSFTMSEEIYAHEVCDFNVLDNFIFSFFVSSEKFIANEIEQAT